MEIELGEIQEKFAKLLWEKEPIASGEVVRLALEQFEWKKSTTYTVLRKLCEKGLFQNRDGIVTSVVSEEDLSRTILTARCLLLLQRLRAEKNYQGKRLRRFRR